MTSKLKCPVCNHKLYQTASEPATYCCLYKDCQSDFKFAGSKELWQALIQAKQDLEIARKALKGIAELALAHDDIAIADEVVGVFDMTDDKDIADEIRKQIEHKE